MNVLAAVEVAVVVAWCGVAWSGVQIKGSARYLQVNRQRLATTVAAALATPPCARYRPDWFIIKAISESRVQTDGHDNL